MTGTTDEKRCTKCGIRKALSAFHINRQSRDGRRAMCKLCYNARERELGAKRRAEASIADGDTARDPGRTTAMLTVVCIYDPTDTFSGAFDRNGFAGTLYDGYWPDGSLWRMAATAHSGEPPARWRPYDGALHEIGGKRIIRPAGTASYPRLEVSTTIRINRRMR